MTIHHDPDPGELPRPALSIPPRRPWSRGEIAMAVTAGALILLALVLFYLGDGGP